MALATLSLDFVAKLATLTADLGKAVRESEKTAAAITAAFEGTKRSIIGIGSELAALYGVRQFVNLIDGAIEAQSALVKLSKQTQLSIEDVGAYGFAAKQAGVGSEELVTSIGRLNVSLAKAAAGDTQIAEPFRKMKIELRDGRGAITDTGTALQQLAERFAGYEEGPKKAALAQAVFGKGYQSVLALLEQGPDTINHNIEFWRKYSGVTAETAERANEFKDRMGELHILTGAFATTLGNELVPTLTAVVNAFIGVREESTVAQDSARGLARVFEVLVEIGAFVVTRLAELGRELAGFAANVDAFVESMNDVGNKLDLATALTNPLGAIQDVFKSWHPKSTAIRDAIKEDAEAGLAVIRKLKEDLASNRGPGSGIDFGRGNGWDPLKQAPDIDPKAAAKAAEVERAIDGLIKKLREQNFAIIESRTAFTELEKVQFLFANDPNISQAYGKKRQEIEKLAKELDALKSRFREVSTEQNKFLRSEHEGQEATDADATSAARDARLKDLEEMSRLFRSGQDPSIGLVKQEEKLRRYMEDIGASALETQKAIEALYNIPSDPMLRSLNEVQNAIQNVASDIDAALGNAFRNSIQGNFKEIGQSFRRMLEDMAVRALQADLMNKLFGGLQPNGQRAGGGWIDALIGIGSQLLGVGGGAIAAQSNGSWDVLPPAVNATPSNVVNVPIQIASGVTRNELAALMPTITQQVQASVIQTMRRPGFSGA